MTYSKGESCLTNKVVCKKCGSFYGAKLLHSTLKYIRTVLRCNNKYKQDSVCNMSYVYEDEIKKTFIKVFNRFIKDKDDIIKESSEVIKSRFDNSKMERKIKKT